MSMHYQNRPSTTAAAITIWTPAFVGNNTLTNRYHTDNIPIVLSSLSSSSPATSMSPSLNDRSSFKLPELLANDRVVSNGSNGNNSSNNKHRYHCHHRHHHHHDQQQQQRNIGIVSKLRGQKWLRDDEHQQQRQRCLSSRKEQVIRLACQKILQQRLRLMGTFSNSARVLTPTPTPTPTSTSTSTSTSTIATTTTTLSTFRSSSIKDCRNSNYQDLIYSNGCNSKSATYYHQRSVSAFPLQEHHHHHHHHHNHQQQQQQQQHYQSDSVGGYLGNNIHYASNSSAAQQPPSSYASYHRDSSALNATSGMLCFIALAVITSNLLSAH
ncbi:unnamed protein product [Litomosoides sigmodontis]|uniref:Uncharacterized protein n=1 Tax=Litomosoides sigmodontis TaxID=42156 RepID=A0A3P6TA47_LITSI|nr:unnamed protein product [Litomosoides sigmodontis]